jgi:hypothetical protein
MSDDNNDRGNFEYFGNGVPDATGQNKTGATFFGCAG